MVFLTSFSERFGFLLMGCAILSSCNGDGTSDASIQDSQVNVGDVADNFISKGCSQKMGLVTDLRPITKGPFKLAKVSCFDKATTFSTQDVIANLAAPNNDMAVLWNRKNALITTASNAPPRLFDLSAPSVRFGSDRRSRASMEWADDSEFIWAIRKGDVKLGAKNLVELQTVQLHLDGTFKSLPKPKLKSSSLVQLMWAGSSGYALGLFVDRTNSDVSERQNSGNLLAFFDASTGKIIGLVRVSDLVKPAGVGNDTFQILNASVVQTKSDGSMMAMFNIGISETSWFVWEQGTKPRRIKNPYQKDQYPTQLAITPDGTKVLITRTSLRPVGGSNTESQTYDPGIPVRGVLAALHSLNDSQQIWSIEARVTRAKDLAGPVINKDGTLALIGYPTDGAVAPDLALIDMSSGRILQKFPAVGGRSSRSSGFAGFDEGGSIWIRGGYATAKYGQ